MNIWARMKAKKKNKKKKNNKKEADSRIKPYLNICHRFEMLEQWYQSAFARNIVDYVYCINVKDESYDSLPFTY